MTSTYDAVIFDLLTGLLDSWTLWNDVAGGPEVGRRWRAEYLRRTYAAGRYRPYLDLVAGAARAVGLPPAAAGELERRWGELRPWPDAPDVLAVLGSDVALAVVTNCSESLARVAVACIGAAFSVVVSAERAGWYKPRAPAYDLALRELGVVPARSLFVAGSPYDVEGASRIGMHVFWHNRIGLPPAPDSSPGSAHLVGTARALWPLIDLVRGPRLLP